MIDSEENDKVIQKRKDLEEAEKMIYYLAVWDAPKVPGAWIKKYGHQFNLKNFTSETFNHQLDKIILWSTGKLPSRKALIRKASK